MLLQLGHWGYEILTAHTLQSFALGSSHATNCTDIAVLGLLHKMTGVAAIQSVHMKLEDDMPRLRVKVLLKALGVLGDDYVLDVNRKTLTHCRGLRI